ncbi:hypothetical protein ACFY7V_03750 [[Kitasatospora] papulosa]|uniref:hypothetical protein n=1 Tax=Streptomyces TaxID=1883 RepID=UPI002FEEF1F4
MNATRMPAALIAAAALLVLTGCTTTTKATPARSTPTCHAVRTAGGDLVHGGPRPCFLAGTATTTPSRPPAAHGQEHTTPAPARTASVPLQKSPARKPTTPLQKDPAPAAKAPEPRAPAAPARRAR